MGATMSDRPAPPSNVPYGPSDTDLAELVALEARVERRVRLRRVAWLAGALLLVVFALPAFVAWRFEERREFLRSFAAKNEADRCCHDEQLESCMASVRVLIGHYQAGEGARPIEWLAERVAPFTPIALGENPHGAVKELFAACPTAQSRARDGWRFGKPLF